MEERQTNYTIMEGYELPSGGKIYDVDINTHIELRSMTARDEMKRVAPSTTPLKTLADVIEGCLIEKPAIHVYDMALGDYEFLLHRLRVVSYGANYKMALMCPFCGEEFEDEADLDTLDIKEFDFDKFQALQTFVAPVSKKTIKLKFATPRLLDSIELKTKELKKQYKNAELDFGLMAKLLNIIDSVDGEKLNIVKAETFINSLPAKDMLKVLNNFDELNKCVGLNTTVELVCPNCLSEVKTFFRFGTEFFRPTDL